MLEHYNPLVQAPLNNVSEVAMGTAMSAGPPITFRQAANNNIGEGTISVKQESNLLEGVCASCGRVITDRYVMRVNERNYHESCLSCAECATPLSHSCYARDCKFYCKQDYQRIYATKCARCQQKIESSDLVMKVNMQSISSRADLSIFHVECFVCCICGDPLVRGAHFILRQGLPLCKREFHNDIFNMNSPQDDDLLDDSRPRDGRRGPKRPRTILTSVQRRQFKASFEVSPKPCRKVREALAKDTGLSVRVVQVWFQNQRAKMKKLQRKAKTESGSDKEPKEERKPESPHSDHSETFHLSIFYCHFLDERSSKYFFQGHYMNALSMRDGESSNFTSATQPLNPNNPYSPDDAYPGHSGDSYCSSDISIDGTEAGFELGESENNGGPDGSHQGGSHSHHSSGGPGGPGPEMSSLSQSLHSAIHNPIDNLFRMSTNYFSGTEHQ
ncbi:LIM homeobox transcription factor 1-beta-like isoform X2 [Phymastichus coffea]|uniref:LIM homeobox transcription factor 1-beta-like isoform X2 n=1 Tax=Phymastichus coffea TaxID=108790 RepID=UPI00273B13CE|nr:LIM homeobox transcription factor 1-beta-like isoform X2 [Phymastichus coffea]